MKLPQLLSRRELLGLATLSVVGAAGWSVRCLVGSGLDTALEESPVPIPDAENVERLCLLARPLQPLFAVLPEPAPNDWLAKHVEFGQTFVQFARSNPDKLGGGVRKICILPLGDLSDYQQRLFVDTGDYLERFFGFPVERLEPAPLDDLPESAQRVRESGARQVHTGHLLNEILRPLCDNETAAVFGLTAHDLWGGDFSFLFGQGSAEMRTCVGSVARFGDVDAGEVDYATCLRRTIGLATHEIGHVFRLPHCTAYSCRMNGSNHLAEADRRPLEFCPECLPKIWWTCRVDPAERFDRLLEFADKHRLTTDAKLWRSARQRLATAKTAERTALHRSRDRWKDD